MWGFVTSTDFLGIAGVLLGLLGVTIRMSVKHFRRLQLVKGLISRVPVALYDVMILDTTGGTPDPLVALRSTNRFSCRETLRVEDYNEQLDGFADKYQYACLYPLRSRVSLAAAVLSGFILVLLGVYLAGKSDPDVQAPLGITSASAQTAAATTSTNVVGATIGARASFENHADAWRHAVLEALPAAGILIAISLSLFFVCFVACYHFGVHDLLVDDVIKLCDTVGVIVFKTDSNGKPKMGHIVAAAADADYKALLRLTGK